MGDQEWLDREEKFQKRLNELKIPYQPCMTLRLTVLRGSDISVGFLHDLVDIPDTQVYVRCESAIGRKVFKTKVAKNSYNPVWNETFTFVLPENAENAIIKLFVFEEDKFKFDPRLGVGEFKIGDLKRGELKHEILDMGKNGRIEFEMLKEFRLSLGLPEDELKFRIERKYKTMRAMQKLLGDEDGPKSLAETPTIALSISGGGYRAAIASAGAMESLLENGIADLLMYYAGLSGSSWYLTAVYLKKAFGSIEKLRECNDELRQKMQIDLKSTLMDMFFFQKFYRYRRDKMKNNQETTLVDFFGLGLREALLDAQIAESTLSSLKDYVMTADVPFPIISCAHVRDKLSASAFWDEVEMTPVEVSFPAYGINVPTDMFNSRWSNGILQQDLPEPPLHFLMATSGSAFAITFRDLSDWNESGTELRDYIRQQSEKDTPAVEEHHKGEVSDSSSEEDEAESTALRPKARTRKSNFASRDDSWIDRVKRKAVADTESVAEKVHKLGRSFLIERTAKVNNCANGYLGMKKFLLNAQPLEEKHEFASHRLRRKMSTKQKNILLCDSGLGCNSPTVHVLRPQRTVDIVIVLCCLLPSSSDSLTVEDFVTLQSQLFDHGIKCPRISIEKISKDPYRDVYLFEDNEDPECPIIIWVTLANAEFRKLNKPPRRPGYPTPDPADSGEVKFNDFFISGETPEYSTLRFGYSPLHFDRLRELVKYNFDRSMKVLKEKIAQKVTNLRDRTKLVSEI